MCLWRAVDDEGEVLDVGVQRLRDPNAALKLLRRLLRNQPANLKRSSPMASHHTRRPWANSVCAICIPPADCEKTIGLENSHLQIRRRERQHQLFKSQASALRFLTTYAAIYNTFYTQRHLVTLPTLRRFRAGAQAA